MPPLHPVLYSGDAAADARVLWLLTLTWAGRTIRLSDDEVDVQTDAGEWRHWHDGLGTIEVTEEITLGGDSSGTLTVPLEAALPEDIDVAALVAAGHNLSMARGELARWIEGTAWESRRVVMKNGRVKEPRDRNRGIQSDNRRFQIGHLFSHAVSTQEPISGRGVQRTGLDYHRHSLPQRRNANLIQRLLICRGVLSG